MTDTPITRRKFTFIAAVAALSLPASLSGCGPSGGSKPVLDIEVTRAFTIGGYDGVRQLVLNIAVKNNGDTSVPAGMVGYMYSTATQDNKTLPPGYLSGDAPEFLPETNIIAGGEGEGQIVFDLAGDGPVEIVVTPETVDHKSNIEVFRQTFDLASVEKVESESTFEVGIDDVKVTDDGKGKWLVVLSITFTNNADSPTSFLSTVRTKLFQNGVGLKESYLPVGHPAQNGELEDNSFTDVKKGASLPLQMVYELLDKVTPVEINMTDQKSYDNRIVLEKTIEVAEASTSTTTA